MSDSSERVKRWRKRTKEKMVIYMGGKCQCCGYNTCHDALAFHHLDKNEKDLSFSKIRANPKSWNKIVEELRKCILVCNNCHSEIHAGFREIPKTFEIFNEEYAEWKKIAEYDNCPKCDNKKPKHQKFCSHKCAQQNRRKVDWDNIDLLDLLSKYRIGELESMLGVSNTAIYKRRNKILKELDNKK